jgi:hypothetical protein
MAAFLAKLALSPTSLFISASYKVSGIPADELASALAAAASPPAASPPAAAPPLLSIIKSNSEISPDGASKGT